MVGCDGYVELAAANGVGVDADVVEVVDDVDEVDGWVVVGGCNDGHESVSGVGAGVGGCGSASASSVGGRGGGCDAPWSDGDELVDVVSRCMTMEHLWE